MATPSHLAPDEVKRLLLIILQDGQITYTDHCLNKSMPEGRITTQDVEFVLECGIVSDKAEWSSEHQNWKYRVIGTDIEGEELGAVFVIIESYLMARIVTVF